MLMCREKNEVVMRKEMKSRYELSSELSKDDHIKNYVKSPILWNFSSLEFETMVYATYQHWTIRWFY
jgi:hypothetical protein